MSEQPRVVFDCNVLLQAALNLTGPARRCLDLVNTDRVILLLSVPVVEELHDVLARPRFRHRRPHLTVGRIDDLLSILSRKALMVEPVPHLIDVRRDRKDERYVDLAIAGGARYLITRDKDLLTLHERQPDGEALNRLYPSLQILDPVQFLTEVAT